MADKADIIVNIRVQDGTVVASPACVKKDEPFVQGFGVDEIHAVADLRARRILEGLDTYRTRKPRTPKAIPVVEAVSV